MEGFSPNEDPEGKEKLGSFWDPSGAESLVRTRCHLLVLMATVRNGEQTGLCVSGGQTPKPGALLRASKLLPPDTKLSIPAVTTGPLQTQSCNWSNCVLRFHTESLVFAEWKSLLSIKVRLKSHSCKGPFFFSFFFLKILTPCSVSTKHCRVYYLPRLTIIFCFQHPILIIWKHISWPFLVSSQLLRNHFKMSSPK